MFFFYNGSEEEGRANFKKFLDIGKNTLYEGCGRMTNYKHPGPVMDFTREIPYEFLNTLQVRATLASFHTTGLKC